MPPSQLKVIMPKIVASNEVWEYRATSYCHKMRKKLNPAKPINEGIRLLRKYFDVNTVLYRVIIIVIVRVYNELSLCAHCVLFLRFGKAHYTPPCQ